MYVIYTGNRKTRPEYLYLSKEFFGGDDSVLDVKVKMIYDGKRGRYHKSVCSLYKDI